MNVNITICDDKEEIIEEIKKNLVGVQNKTGYELTISSYTEGNKVVEEVCSGRQRCDVILLDIDMPTVSGFQVAKSLAEYSEKIIIVFISAHDEFVFDAIEYQPFRYLRKSRLDKELPLAMTAVFKRFVNQIEKPYILKTEDSEIKLFHSDIMYFEKQSRKVYVYLASGKVVVSKKNIKELYEDLNDDNFVKVYSGCVVNVKYITTYGKDDITLDNNKQLLVSRRNMKEVKERLTKYWGGLA